ncbi:putative N-acetyltransferase [Cavenderia fasciculata]|uniref:N-acetyltransferase n=1 Tax=Cavenderia fasciculata TaxID=261658 RepID=F4PHF9_CACFS|nr:putative N-acetyltransferase [Cavenderia fasciculata]EGG25143.1 putative N-acetyltransferase [Cavenderia fasciculata]|eukprot:XP_004362994.1 putative N-acetyltransferase [Cavenderia fasciculata]
MTDDGSGLPTILCAIQVSLEGAIAKEAILNSIRKGYQSSGDLIPWTLTQHFQDEDFPRLSGARVVRIATHPDYQKMGYGTKSLELLTQYYQGDINTINEEMDEDEENEDDEDEEEEAEEEVSSSTISKSNLLIEKIKPKKNLPPLLYKLTERKPELLHYVGVSYGVTSQLYQFWSKSGYLPVYLRLASNDITGEHSCIMLKELKIGQEQQTIASEGWLSSFYQDFRKRFISLLGYDFRNFQASLALNILQDKLNKDNIENLDLYFSSYDLKRLESYTNNLVDYNVIVDMLPMVGKLLFSNQLNQVRSNLSLLQMAVILAISLQHKSLDQLATELNVQHNQVLSVFSQAMRRVSQALKQFKQQSIDDSIPKPKKVFKSKNAIVESVQDELESEEKKIKEKLYAKQEEEEEEEEVLEEPKKVKALTEKEKKKANAGKKDLDMDQFKEYLIDQDEEVWSKALKGGKIPTTISVPSAAGKRKQTDGGDDEDGSSSKKEAKDIQDPHHQLKKLKESKQQQQQQKGNSKKKSFRK